MKNCETCIYEGLLAPETAYDRNGYVIETKYLGIRCTNEDCIFYKSPSIPLINAGLDNCKGYKENK